MTAADTQLATKPPRFSELLREFGRIGCLSFGGPAGQIALMHSMLVDDKKWVKEDEFLHALNFCHLLPGPEAQQLATWIGWKLHGIKGGLAAGLLFVIPGALVIMALSIFYAVAANLSWFAAVFLGIKAAVLAIVAQALIRIAKRSLDSPFKKALALAAFISLFFLNLPFPIVVLSAGVLGAIIALYRPDWLALKPGGGAAITGARPWGESLRAIAIWAVIWATPMVLIYMTLGSEHILWRIGSFFSQLAVVTFGGAYAVLAYMAQQAVDGFGWLSAGEMADGLGLAETTPGPLILVTQFVGYLAAFRTPDPFTPIIAGIIGASLTVWVTFAPCFLWIFTFAPWIERMQNSRWLKGGLAALTAAVVGVIANLSVWFALHVIFRQIDTQSIGPIRLFTPEWTSLDWRAAVLAALSAYLLFGRGWNIIKLLGLVGIAGLALGYVG
jgi:chromate transporter